MKRIVLIILCVFLLIPLLSCGEELTHDEAEIKEMTDFIAEYNKSRKKSIFNYSDDRRIYMTPEIAADMYIKILSLSRQYTENETEMFVDYSNCLNFLTRFHLRPGMKQLYFYGYGMDPKTDKDFLLGSYLYSDSKCLQRQRDFIIELYGYDAFEAAKYEIIPIKEDDFPYKSLVILDFSESETQSEQKIYFSFTIGENGTGDWRLLSGLEWQYEPHQ